MHACIVPAERPGSLVCGSLGRSRLVALTLDRPGYRQHGTADHYRAAGRKQYLSVRRCAVDYDRSGSTHWRTRDALRPAGLGTPKASKRVRAWLGVRVCVYRRV